MIILGVAKDEIWRMCPVKKSEEVKTKEGLKYQPDRITIAGEDTSNLLL